MPDLGYTGEQDFAAALLAKSPEGFLAPEPDSETDVVSPNPAGDDAKPDAADDTLVSEDEAGGDTSEPEDTAPSVEEDDGPYLELDDPSLIAYLNKYEGDIVAALKAAVEAQGIIGRQGSELGGMRAQVEALRAAVETSQATPQAVPGSNFPIVQQIAESDPAAAAAFAAELGDNVSLQYAVNLWKEEDPFAAALFVSRYEREQEGHSEGTPEPQVAATLGVLPGVGYTQQDLDTAIGAVVQKHPDINEYVDAIGTLASEMPLFDKALREGTPLERANALETLTVMAKTRHGADTSSQALERVRIRLKADADVARSDAAVVSATRRAVVEKPSRSDEELLPGFTRGMFREKTGLPPLEED